MRIGEQTPRFQKSLSPGKTVDVHHSSLDDLQDDHDNLKIWLMSDVMNSLTQRNGCIFMLHDLCSINNANFYSKIKQPIQRVAVTLAQNNFNVTAIKLGLKSEQMVQMANHWKPPLWDGIEKPDVIICPLMKTRIPPELYENVLTLVVHPGPPGDRGASALDWCVHLKESKWGVTVLEAAEDYDAGNVWGFELFDVGEKDTKSSIYRSQVQTSAINSIILALERVKANKKNEREFIPNLATQYNYGILRQNWKRTMRHM